MGSHFAAWSSLQVSKATLQEDLYHVLKAIIRGLDNHLFWPDAAERRMVSQQYTGMFENVDILGEKSIIP